jgi:hypothetical protein
VHNEGLEYQDVRSRSKRATPYKKSGSKEPLRNFRIAIKKLTESNHLPDYRLRFNAEEDKLTVYLRSHKGGLRELKDVLHLI